MIMASHARQLSLDAGMLDLPSPYHDVPQRISWRPSLTAGDRFRVWWRSVPIHLSTSDNDLEANSPSSLAYADDETFNQFNHDHVAKPDDGRFSVPSTHVLVGLGILALLGLVILVGCAV